MKENESKLIDYIMNTIKKCPFKYEVTTDFEEGCVVFGEKGCKECIYRNMDKLQ